MMAAITRSKHQPWGTMAENSSWKIIPSPGVGNVEKTDLGNIQG